MTEEIREEAHVLGGGFKREPDLDKIIGADIVITIQPKTESGRRELQGVVARIREVLPGPLDDARSVPSTSAYRSICRSGVTYYYLIDEVSDLAKEPVDICLLVLEDHGQSQEGS